MENPVVFKLETAIATWRHQFKHSRLFQKADVDELERAIRDQVEFLVERGSSEEDAFRKTISELGSYDETESEYRKVFWAKLRDNRGVARELIWNLSMLKNYLKVSIRSLVKHRAYSFINILGLTVGVACCLVIYLFVRHELSYDRFHEQADNIYRLTVDWTSQTSDFKNALSSAPMGPAVQSDFPDVLGMVRFKPEEKKVLVRYEDKRFYTDHNRFMYADPSVFSIFSFRLIGGDPTSALAEPNTIVLTESMARKYFDEEDPVGNILQIDERANFLVTGVMEDVPPNAHFHFDFLTSLENLSEEEKASMESWGWNPFFTFLLLPSEYDVARLEAQFPEMLAKHAGDNYSDWRLELQPLTDIHLNQYGNEIEAGSSTLYVYLLAAIAVLILAIACFNFINLTTARSSTRAREISMRKVAGARRGQLIVQFIGESVLLSLVGMVLSLLLVLAILPTVGQLVGQELSLDFTWGLVALLIVLIVIIGVTAGAYPALVMSRFNPVALVKGLRDDSSSGRSPKRLRGALVIFQFTISIVLIAGTLIVFRQLNFMHTKALGLEPEQVVVVPVQSESALQQVDALKSELLRVPGVNNVGFSSRKPGMGAWGTGMRQEGQSADDGIGIKYMFIDHDYLSTLDIELIAGRNFSKEQLTDEDESVILNEQGVYDLGWSSPQEAIGEYVVVRSSSRIQVIGVVGNFHFQTFRTEMQPLSLFLTSSGADYMFLKISAADVESTLAGATKVWNQISPKWPMIYSFLDQDYQNLYTSEERFGNLFGIFTLLALFIACLGLFGLATFSVERRTKEIGIRKALGASAREILVLLSKEIAILVVVANVIAWPVAYFAAQSWLQSYPFRTSVSIWVFVIASFAALLIAWLSISYQALQASRANPVEALRYE